MTLTLSVLAFIVAAILFAISAWWSPPRGNFIGAGLFFLTVALATGLHQVRITS